MDLQASIEQVAGILARADLRFSTHADGDAYRLLFDRDAVFVNFERWGGDGVVITVSSPVLQDIGEETAGAAVVLQRLGDLNRRHRFFKFLFVEGDLMVATDLLGDTLQSGELLNAVYGVAAVAELVGDELEEATGGTRYADLAEETADEDIAS